MKKLFAFLKNIWNALTSSSGPLVDARTNVANSNISHGTGSPIVTVNNNVSSSSPKFQDDNFIEQFERSPKGYFIDKKNGDIICPRCLRKDKFSAPMSRDAFGLLVCSSCGNEIEDQIKQVPIHKKHSRIWWL